MKTLTYILNEDGVPVPETDMQKWIKWFAEHYNRFNTDTPRILKSDNIGEFLVNTVFLAVDREIMDNKDPVLWECMVYAPHVDHPLHAHSSQCSGTSKEALLMHDQMCQYVRERMYMKKGEKAHNNPMYRDNL